MNTVFVDGDSTRDKVPWEAYMKEDHYQLSEASGGYGVITFYGGSQYRIPKSAENFMYEMFHKYVVTKGGLDANEHLIEWCWSNALHSIDAVEPYVMFYGGCDVIITDESYYYQYRVSKNGDDWEDASPDNIETFKLNPEGFKHWEELMRNPGLQNTTYDFIYDYFSDHFSFVMADDHPEAYEAEWQIITDYGPKAQSYAHLGIWAAIMWLTSPIPEAKAWRAKYHPVFQICYEDRECVLHDFCFHDPRYFKKEMRKPKSCYKCGEDQHCVDLTVIDHKEAAYICEHCLSNGEPFSGRTCGTTFCDKITCPHHPAADPNASALTLRKNFAARKADARFGELQYTGYGKQVARELPGYIKLQEIATKYYENQIGTMIEDNFAKMIEDTSRTMREEA